LAEVLIAAWRGTPQTATIRAASKNEADVSGATHLVEGYLTTRGAEYAVHASLRDLRTNRTIQVATTQTAARSGAIEAGKAIARAFIASPRPLTTNNDAALRLFAEAIRTADPTSGLEAAIALDPGYSDAHLALIETHVRRGNREGAERAIERARGTALPAEAQARVNYLAATLSGDRSAAARALEEVAKSHPHDAGVLRSLAEARYNARDFKAAAQWYQRILQIEPESVQALNLLGYSLAHAGDVAGAREALEQYAKLAPGNPNPADSLGDAYYINGRFDEAAQQYLKAFEIQREFLGGMELMKAALARLMQGDAARAHELAEKFAKFREEAKDPLVEYHRARWEYMTGKREAAIARLNKLLAGTPEAHIARAQLAAWLLDGGDREGARKQAALAMKSGQMNARLAAALCWFAAQPEMAAAEWRARADRTLPAAVRNAAVGYALLFSKRFAEAVEPLRRAWENSSPGSTAAVPLAWAYVESKQLEPARAVLERFPTPPVATEDVFEFLVYPRVLELRRLVFGG
jgi:Flp pilus assembly protein TadD